MIISRTPFRISFFGGGTDYPQWFNEHGGAVLATSIDKYCYVMLHDGIVNHTLDLPTKSGMATSSAYTVGLLRACTNHDQKTISKLATVWEQDKMNSKVGSQDQYICAVGGFHLLRFDESGIRDTVIDPGIIKPLERYLMLFDTHQYRRAGDIVEHQLSEMGKHTQILLTMMNMVDEGLKCISNPLTFGKLLHEAWVLKRQLSDYVTTPKIDFIYETALKAGAVGGKLLGAGGGGFILFFVDPEKQESVKSTLSDLTHVPFKFENEGSKIIYKD